MERISRRTRVFLIFMAVFFPTVGYLTYYSNVVYLRNLPRPETVMPEYTGEHRNGREVYEIPMEALHQTGMGKCFVYAARHFEDELGERYLVELVYVYRVKDTGTGVMVDGLNFEDAVIVKEFSGMRKGMAVSL